jgi:transposase
VSNASAPGTWLADLCAREGLPCVRGHGLHLQALHGGTAKHDPIASHTIAVLRRGGLRPQAYVYPADRRATRDLRRRRRHLMRTRAALLAHLHNTHRQYNLPDIGKTRADKANRDGVAERLPAPAVQQSMAVDRALSHPYDCLRGDVALSILDAAKHHPAQTLSFLRTVPGIGELLSSVSVYELNDLGGCPRVHAFVSDGRLVTCTKASVGQR